MDVRNCRQCGKLYNYIGGSYRNLCPSCIKQLEDKFVEIKEYIRDNKVASISEISDKFEVSTKQIEQWVREERLTFTDNSPVGIECENCGAMIRTGRFCDACKNKMASNLKKMYEMPPKEDKGVRQRDKDRMRFLDKT